MSEYVPKDDTDSMLLAGFLLGARVGVARPEWLEEEYRNWPENWAEQLSSFAIARDDVARTTFASLLESHDQVIRAEARTSDSE